MSVGTDGTPFVIVGHCEEDFTSRGAAPVATARRLRGGNAGHACRWRFDKCDSDRR